MHKGRPFKRIWGIAYKNVLKGDNPTQEVTASQHDRDQLYNDPAIRLSEADLQRFKSLKGKPICREHDPNVVLGHIHSYDVDSADGHLRVMARIFTDTEDGRQAAAQLERGELNGLSVGYTTNMVLGTTKVASKTFNELTLTEEPFFEGCQVTVQASKKKNLALKESTYNTEVLWIKLSKEENMSEPVENTTPAIAEQTEEKNEVPQKEASSLLKVADGLQEQVDEAKANAEQERSTVEELRRKLEQMEKEKALLQDFKQREEAAYAKAKEAEARETLKIHEEMRGQAFSEDVQQAMIQTMCSKNPVNLAKTEILCSQAKAFQDQKEARLKAEAANKDLMEQLAKQKEEVELAQQRITASRYGVRDLYGARQSDKGKEEEEQQKSGGVEVNASRGGLDQYFPYRGNTSDEIRVPQASPMELELNLPFFKQTPAATLPITASRDGRGMSIKSAPRHNLVDQLEYSMRNAPNAHWFSLMVSQKDMMMSGPDCVLRSDREDGMRKYPDTSKDISINE